MKKIIVLAALIAIFISITFRYENYQAEFYEFFDTLTIVTGYEKNKKDFDTHYAVVYDEMERLHKLFDIYNEYEGINNIKTINDNAGIKPVVVDKDLIGLIEFGKAAYSDTNGEVNIALGSVLEVWRKHRESETVPSAKELKQAAIHTNINDIIINKDAGTVFLNNKKMSLDVGAIAKGYAIELTGKKARESGFDSGIINGGGNIYILGKPKIGNKKWAIGIQNPYMLSDGKRLFDTIFLTGGAIVSSGDYRRSFAAGGQTYHHIIDSETLMPADRYNGVTVIHADSGIADMLSTALFIMPQEEGKRLVEHFGGEAIWILTDKSYTSTDGYKKISKLYDVNN